jgi:hypothetical protein
MLSSVKQWLVRHYIRRAVLSLSKVSIKGLERFVPREEAQRLYSERGYDLLKRHYYSPIPDQAELDDSFWKQDSALIGVEMNETGALNLLENVFPLYMEEFRQLFPLHREEIKRPEQFYLINGAFMAIDAHVYYAFVRHFRPKRIVEIGSGFSTLIAAACVKKVEEEEQASEAPRLTAIEPYPPPFLREGLAGLSQLVERKVQDVDLDLFTSLEAGDILFIDSTHVLRAGGDVQMEYCEILPRLAPGVIVHIHDISLPKSYPRIYFEKEQYYWNEQYLLQAFLTFNSRFEVLWPGNYMMLKYPEQVTTVFPEFNVMRERFPLSEPSSFWMRLKA